MRSPDCLGCTLVCRGAGTCRLGEVLEPEGEPSLLLQQIHQPVPVGDARAGSARCACEWHLRTSLTQMIPTDKMSTRQSLSSKNLQSDRRERLTSDQIMSVAF